MANGREPFEATENGTSLKDSFIKAKSCAYRA